MGNKESRSNGRHTAKEKKEIVLRLLRGEPIDEVARELNLPVHVLAQWRDDFIEAGTEGLKSRPVSLAEKRLKAAQAKIGELSMQVEILQEYLKKKRALATAADVRELLMREDGSRRPVKLVCATLGVARSSFYRSKESEEKRVKEVPRPSSATRKYWEQSKKCWEKPLFGAKDIGRCGRVLGNGRTFLYHRRGS